MSQTQLYDLYGIRWFTDALQNLFEDNPPDLGNQNTELVITEHDRITIYPKATQVINDDLGTGITNIIHVSPQTSLNRLSPSGTGRCVGRFNTMLIQNKVPEAAEYMYGMDGDLHLPRRSYSY
jgi:hypothetical protein